MENELPPCNGTKLQIAMTMGNSHRICAFYLMQNNSPMQGFCQPHREAFKVLCMFHAMGMVLISMGVCCCCLFDFVLFCRLTFQIRTQTLLLHGVGQVTLPLGNTTYVSRKWGLQETTHTDHCTQHSNTAGPNASSSCCSVLLNHSLSLSWEPLRVDVVLERTEFFHHCMMWSLFSLRLLFVIVLILLRSYASDIPACNRWWSMCVASMSCPEDSISQCPLHIQLLYSLHSFLWFPWSRGWGPCWCLMYSEVLIVAYS